MLLFFFFQAEDGIRDVAVTGVQTCALPIYPGKLKLRGQIAEKDVEAEHWNLEDRKSTRLNSSHGYISYAVFCLKKKKKNDLSTTSTEQVCNPPAVRPPSSNATTTSRVYTRH